MNIKNGMEKLSKEQLVNVTGGVWETDGYLGHVSYLEVVGHYGGLINKYQTEDHIGERIIYVTREGAYVGYQLGTILESTEESRFLGTSTFRKVKILWSDGNAQTIPNPHDMWLYVD